MERWRTGLHRWFHPAEEGHGSCGGWGQASSKGFWGNWALWRSGFELCPLLSYPPSSVFHTLFPHLSCLLAVHRRDPSGYRSLTFQARSLLAALALSISYPQIHAACLEGRPHIPPTKQSIPDWMEREEKNFWRSNREKMEEKVQEVKPWSFQSEKQLFPELGSVLLRTWLPIDKCWTPQKIWSYCSSQMIFTVAIHELHEGWDPEHTNISIQELQTVPRTETSDMGGKTMCGNKWLKCLCHGMAKTRSYACSNAPGQPHPLHTGYVPSMVPWNLDCHCKFREEINASHQPWEFGS